ncbi:MAG: hypothetical protein WD627_09005, partial [Actinomycetota bacterium]
MKQRTIRPSLIRIGLLLILPCIAAITAHAEPAGLSVTPAPQNTELGQRLLAAVSSPLDQGRL